MHDHPLLAEAAAVADYLLGPADRVPVYLVTTAQAGERFACNDGCLAYTGPGLCFGLAALLQSAGRWQGLGFAAVVDTDRLQRLPGHPITNAVAIVAHELCHFLECDPPADIRLTDRRIVEEVLAACQTADFSYFYCPKSSTLIDPQRRQAVTGFVVIEPGFFVALQAAGFVGGDLAGRVALVLSAQEHRDAVADLRDRDRWGPLFSPAALHARETTWR